MKGVKQIVGPISHTYKYIRFPDKIMLKNVKILKAKARDSHFWLWHPYVIDIEYAKEWKEETVVYVNKIPITTYVYHYTKEYSFKYKDIEEVKKIVKEMKDAEVDIENEIKRSRRHI